MHRFLDWPPIFWTLRIGILIVLAGGLHVFVLLISRFFRWANIRSMLLADPPRVESLGGEFAGAKAELKLFQHVQGEQQRTMDQRVTDLETGMRMVLRRMGLDDQRPGIGDE
jgi:hypothetical protein